MNREAAKQRIDILKKQMLENVQKLIDQRHIYGEVLEINIHGKVHRMMHYKAMQNNVPVYFDIHGGGFAWGRMEEGDLFCHQICEQLGFEVYALDYPLVPEAEYPDALEWLYETISYIAEHSEEYNIDPNKMIVGGRSAGGNLAAALCLLAKERKQFQFVCQVLDHPYLDLCGIIGEDERYKGKDTLSGELMELIATAYAVSDMRKERYCSPLNATIEQLKELPPAVIQTCEFDFLQPDGERYASLLQKAKVKVISHCYTGAFHGFTEVEGAEEKNGQQWLIEGMKCFIV